MGKQEEISR